jgi:hypothetical protein
MARGSEKASPAVASDWESRQYFLDESDVSNAEVQQIWEGDKKDPATTI